MNYISKKFDLLKNWLEKNEKYLSPLFFIFGFIIDNLTLTRVDLLFDNLVIISYLFIASVVIILINFAQTKNIKNDFFKLLPFAMQFIFGGLFSAYSIFYTKSASIASSWIFLLILYAFFIGNERLRKNYEKFSFQIGILFVAIFSFMIFSVPVVLKQIGDWVFLVSGLLSLLIIFSLIYLLFNFVLNKDKLREKKIIKNIFGIYAIFNLLYFLNIIPPIPLAMKEIGVYKNLERVEVGDYILQKYQQPWYQVGNYFLKIPVGAAYVYSSVFAPADLNTSITHIWQKYNVINKKWVVVNKINYPIYGGRNDGYRGYSFKSNLTKGRWRVDVVTGRGQVVGRIKFTVI